MKQSLRHQKIVELVKQKGYLSNKKPAFLRAIILKGSILVICIQRM